MIFQVKESDQEHSVSLIRQQTFLHIENKAQYMSVGRHWPITDISISDIWCLIWANMTFDPQNVMQKKILGVIYDYESPGEV